MTHRERTGRRAAVARIVVSAALLFGVALLVDPQEVARRLTQLRGGWVALGLGLSVLQVLALAWRWRFTAARLGIDLPLREAVGEYYLGILLNQLLPGGVSGDVSRAWRHARTPAPAGPAVRAVILERVSAQVIMTTIAIGSLLALPRTSGPARLGAAGALMLGGVVTLATVLRRASPESMAGRIWSDTRTAVLAPGVLYVQLSSGALVVASYIVLFLIAARAVGVDTPVALLLPLVAPVLLAMLIPITVAGWGVREGAAAALWGLVGLRPEDGVAISVAYGLLVLVSSTPGVVILIRVLIGSRDRRARRSRDGSDDSSA